MLTKNDIEKVVKHEIGHYILDRYNNIVPKQIHFNYENPDFLKGDCEICYNLYLDNLNEISNFSYQRAMIVFAGAAAACLDFNQKRINQKQAKIDFAEKEISDNTKFDVHLITYLMCDKSIRGDKNPETLSIRTKDLIFNKVFEIIEKYSDLIKELTEYILPKVLELCGEGEICISNNDLNSITHLTSEFGRKNPSIWDFE